jgi:hypothetical protein
MYKSCYDKYKLIGIGEFSHGIIDVWKFRLCMLKDIINTTNKNVCIFNEMSIWQGNNIQNHTYYDNKTDKFVKYAGLKKEKEYTTNEGYVGGKLWQYVHHSRESKIFVDIIKYIWSHSNRIKIIGVDNDKLSRDLDMYNIIINNLDVTNINLFWAHNGHIDDRKLSVDTYHWTKSTDPNVTHSCGHYLKQRLKNKYCIILSQAYKGINRFNGYCSGYACTHRTFQLRYFYKSFRYKPNKKYVFQDNCVVLTSFSNRLIEFSNSYFKQHKYGYQDLIKTNGWDYILFFNKVDVLEPYYEY